MAHRDYEDASRKIHVALFAGRVEVISPGLLPQGLTGEQLRSEALFACPALDIRCDVNQNISKDCRGQANDAVSLEFSLTCPILFCIYGSINVKSEAQMEIKPRFFQESRQSFFLFGPRGTGKSTWLKHRYPKAFLIDLLDPEVFGAYSARNHSFLRVRLSQRGGPNRRTSQKRWRF